MQSYPPFSKVYIKDGKQRSGIAPSERALQLVCTRLQRKKIIREGGDLPSFFCLNSEFNSTLLLLMINTKTSFSYFSKTVKAFLKGCNMYSPFLIKRKKKWWGKELWGQREVKKNFFSKELLE